MAGSGYKLGLNQSLASPETDFSAKPDEHTQGIHGFCPDRPSSQRANSRKKQVKSLLTAEINQTRLRRGQPRECL